MKCRVIFLVLLWTMCSHAASSSYYKTIAKKSGKCPLPKSLTGTCIFDPYVNCLSDAGCPDLQKCCPEGCKNRVCKIPLKSNFLDGYDWPDFAMNKVDWSWLHKTKSVINEMVDKFWDIAA